MADIGEHSEGSKVPFSELQLPPDIWQDIERAEQAARSDAYEAVGGQIARLISLEAAVDPLRMYHRTYHEGNSRRVVIARSINGVMQAHRIIVNDWSVDIYDASCVTIEDTYVGYQGLHSFAQKITATRQRKPGEPWDDSTAYGPVIQGDVADLRWPVCKGYHIPPFENLPPLGCYLLQPPVEGPSIEPLDIPGKLMELHGMLRGLDRGTRVESD